MAENLESSSAQNRRRWRIVDRPFQMKYTMMVVGFTAIISLMYSTLVYLEHYEVQKEIGEYCGSSAAAHLFQRSTSIIGYILAATFLISTLVAFLGMIATHRIAGPLFVMNRYLGVLTTGRIPFMRPLRKNDELKKFYATLQTFVESLGRRERNEAERLKSALETLTPLATTRESQQALQSLRTMFERKLEATEGTAPNARPERQTVEQAA